MNKEVKKMWTKGGREDGLEREKIDLNEEQKWVWG